MHRPERIIAHSLPLPGVKSISSEPLDASVPARGRAVIAWALWILLAGNAVAITVLWARGGNLSGLNSAGRAFSSLGRITGLLGGYALLIQVILLMRVPGLEQLVGFDRLTVWHRINGKLSLYLILAHVVFITIGYMLLDRISLWAEIQSLLGNYPGMVTATFGTAAIVLVVLTSLVVVRRRLRYEWWYLVHLLAYAGIILAWFHQLPTGNEFITNATARAYWIALYVATLAIVFFFRLAQPAIKAWWYGLRVSEVVVEGPGVVSVRLVGRHLDRLHALPGQFFLWRFLDGSRWGESHPFSLSEAPDGRTLRLTAKALGDFSGALGGVRPGTRVVAEGPFGTFTPLVQRRDRVALIAGGIGITPIRALLEVLPGDIVLIYRVLSRQDLVFQDEIDRLARVRGITVHYVIGDHRDPGGARLLSPEHLRELVPDLPERDIFLCGPPGMVNAIVTNVRAAGASASAIHLERFALSS